MEKHLRFLRSPLWILSGLMMACLLLGEVASAQTTTGAFVGTITDVSGGAVPNVKVTLTEQGTNAQHVVYTNRLGQYAANLLPIGTYTVRAELQGFKTESITDVPLQVNQTVREDIQMQVGAVTQTIQVTGEVPLIKTDASDNGAVIGAKESVELPLNGRNFLQLASLAAGAFPVTNVDAIMAGGGGIISNGADSNANELTFDSVENQDYLVPRVAITPSPDAIAEFKIMTGDYGAEYGRAGGANINVLMKSGDNQLHGSAYEFVRTTKLNARNFFQPGNNAPFHQNQFGGTVGGPIRKNKLFFFGSYDGFRQEQGLTASVIVPTAAQRQGDLSTGPNIFDPLTTTSTTPITRTAFQGNIIPTSRISPQATNALSLLWPLPQSQTPNVVNAVFNPNQPISWNQEMVRIDYNPNNKDRVWGHFSYNKNPELEPTYNLSAGFPGEGSYLIVSQQNHMMGWTRTISPTIVNEARVGYNRYFQNLYPQMNQANIVGEIGINGLPQPPSEWGPPIINITGMTNAGSSPNAPSRPRANDFEYLDTLSLVVKGGHSLKIGADFRRAQMNGEQFANTRGRFTFGTGESNDPQNSATTGQGMASFLLGYPSSTSATLGMRDNDIRALNGGIFIQDDWTISRQLTLNLGLRYDYMPSPVSAGDRISNWDVADQAMVLSQNNLNAPTACDGCNSAPYSTIIKNYPMFKFATANAVGWSRSLVASDYHDFSPRLGMAWRVLGSDKTVLRGAWGRFYEVFAGNGIWNFSANQPFANSVAYSANALLVPSLTFANGFPSTSVATGAPGITSGQLYNWQDPYNDNWNITLQRRLPYNTAVTIAYVGTDGVGQPTYVNFNSAQFGILSSLLLQPNQNIGGTSIYCPWGRSWYNSLQTTLETHLKSLSILANYTWANALTEGGGGINQNFIGFLYGWNFPTIRTPVLTPRLDPNDIFLRLGKGDSGVDLHQRFSISYVWDLPFGRGRWKNLKGPADWVAGGWELSGITTAETGFPQAVGGASSAVNVVGNPQSGAPRTIHEWFNTSAFAAAPSTLYVYNNNLNPWLAVGNTGRANVWSPGLVNWDFGIYKNFPFRERYRIQLRGEFFNGFNNVNWGGAGTTLGTSTFGVITSALAARQVQLAGKIYF